MPIAPTTLCAFPPRADGRILPGMRIAKPLLLVTTPLGVAGGLWQAWQLAGGLAVLMLALVAMMACAVGSVVVVARRERATEAARRADGAQP